MLEGEWGVGAVDPTQIQIQATGATRFRSDTELVRIAFTGFADYNYFPDEQDLRLSLCDLTTSTVLLDVTASSDWPAWTGPGFDGVYFVELDQAHEHELVLSGWITSWDAKQAQLGAQVGMMPIAAVPEPGAVGLLLCGLAAVWRRAVRARR